MDIIKSELIEDEIVELDEPSEPITPSPPPLTPLITPESTHVVTPMIVQTSSAQSTTPSTVRITPGQDF